MKIVKSTIYIFILLVVMALFVACGKEATVGEEPISDEIIDSNAITNENNSTESFQEALASKNYDSASRLYSDYSSEELKLILNEHIDSLVKSHNVDSLFHVLTKFKIEISECSNIMTSAVDDWVNEFSNKELSYDKAKEYINSVVVTTYVDSEYLNELLDDVESINYTNELETIEFKPVTLSEIREAYNQNPLRADSEYLDSYVVIEGYVRVLSSEGFAVTEFQSEDLSYHIYLSCNFDNIQPEFPSTLLDGDKVCVYGKIIEAKSSECTMSVMKYEFESINASQEYLEVDIKDMFSGSFNENCEEYEAKYVKVRSFIGGITGGQIKQFNASDAPNTVRAHSYFICLYDDSVEEKLLMMNSGDEVTLYARVQEITTDHIYVLRVLDIEKVE